MTSKTRLAGLALAALIASPALAEITIQDPYARASMPNAPTGAAFMMIANDSDEPDRLIAAASDIAARVELHTHIADEQGVMRMREVEGGFEIPAGGMHALQRGGDHVMFMGLKEPLVDGETVTVTLTFENAGEMTIEVPVDLQRGPGAMGHGGMTNGEGAQNGMKTTD